MNRSCSRLLAVLSASAVAAGLSACGKHQEEEPGGIIRTETEGIYLHLDHLKYQVQISRQLNPTDVADRGYLRAVDPAQRTLADDEVWFGVFLRVQNDTDESHPVSRDIHIVDTQENEFDPVPMGQDNVFRYDPPAALPPSAIEPRQDSAAADSPIQGSLLLFKVKNSSLDNRPLELVIKGRDVPQKTGIVNLDV